MEDRWRDSGAARFPGPLGECVYGSRLLGSDPALVLHGGGNTSVKTDFADITGRRIEALYVKGSGWDLASIEAEGFTPLPLDRLRELAALDAMSDVEMMRELGAARLDPGAPMPSVETLLHALLPHRAVQHSHADAVVTLTNTPEGERLVREALGAEVMIVPYVMPGFDLAKAAAEMGPPPAGAPGMVLMNHGLFTFGPDTRTAYRRHIELIDRAERWLAEKAPAAEGGGPPLPPVDRRELAGLRRRISQAAGRPMVVTRGAGAEVSRFAARPDLEDLARRGPLTPDHVIRTKRLPMVGRGVEEYADAYREYFAAWRGRARTEPSMLDPAPRVVLDPELGMLAAGETAEAAAAVADIYLRTIPVLERAEDHLGGYRALPPGDLFEVEYWDLEQAKLRRAGAPPELAGAAAVVTGAASGIGRACAAELLARGCAVAGLDRNPAVEEAFSGPAWLGLTVDVTDHRAQEEALDRAAAQFGGVDIAAAAAGVFGASAPVSGLDMEGWRRVMEVNLDAAAALLAGVHPLLAQSPIGGRAVLIGSRNAPAPGQGAAAYSASKAALTQLGRVAALEWAADGIRVNVVHPDAVFDTGLWTEELLAARSAEYGISVDEYKTRNLLGCEVTSETVAKAAVALCSDEFPATTAAQVPVDGGHPRAV